MTFLLIFLIAGLPTLVVMYVIFFFGSYAYSRAKLKEISSADTVLRKIKLKADDPKYEFDGAKAEIVAQRLEHIRYTFEDLHRICRNEYGEYFLLISCSPPYICHLPQERAREAMTEMERKNKYEQDIFINKLLPKSFIV